MGAGFGLAATGPGVSGSVRQLDALLVDTVFDEYQQNNTNGLFVTGSKRRDGLPLAF